MKSGFAELNDEYQSASPKNYFSITRDHAGNLLGPMVIRGTTATMSGHP